MQLAWQLHLLLRMMQKNKNAIIGMLFGAGIGIIFNSTGLGLPIGAGVGLVLGLILNQHNNNNN